jgi:hypothetical protein
MTFFIFSSTFHVNIIFEAVEGVADCKTSFNYISAVENCFNPRARKEKCPTCPPAIIE